MRYTLKEVLIITVQLGVMKENKLLKQAKRLWYTYTDIETGEVFKFQSKEFIPLMEEREDVREQIYKRIWLGKPTILQYKNDTLDIDILWR